MEARIKLGISACLLGENVRYDGKHKQDLYLIEALGQIADLVPVCPEAELGLGVPREIMRLEGDPSRPRLLTVHTRLDITDRMLGWARQKVRSLDEEQLDGFIFKCRSPSCGLRQVPVHNRGGEVSGAGTGLFARVLMECFPALPMGEEGDLLDSAGQKNFIDRVLLFRRRTGHATSP